jgi:serine/threonine protein kinase
MVARFEREIEISKIVTHTNVCRIYDLGLHFSTDSQGHSAEVPFATMELLAGQPLAAELRKRGQLTTGEVLPLIRQVAAALDAVHDSGIVHCDLKPSNIMIVPVGHPTPPRVVLMDFGLARRSSESGEAPGGLAYSDTTGGTPDYMSPEQVSGGTIDRRSDIYSFGVLIYRMITGMLPFAGPSGAIRMRKRLWEDPVPVRQHIPGLETEWETAIQRCLSIDAHQRFSRASDVIIFLSQAARENTSETLK